MGYEVNTRKFGTVCMYYIWCDHTEACNRPVHQGNYNQKVIASKLWIRVTANSFEKYVCDQVESLLKSVSAANGKKSEGDDQVV
jgi:hypothetical protein